jgi:hypothetical protein
MPPIFEGNKIVLQLVRAPLPTFSAALIAYVEANYEDQAVQNKLCGNVPFPHTLADYPRTMAANMMNQMQWGQDKTLRAWMHDSRLDGFAKLMTSVDPSDVEKLAILGDLKAQAKAAMGNMAKLLATAKTAN